MCKKRGWGQIRQERSGNYAARYTAPDGNVYKADTTFSKRHNAEAWLASERQLIETGTWTPPTGRGLKAPRPKPIEFGAYAATEVARRKLAERTRADYQGYLDRFILPRWGRVPLAAIDRDEVRAWHSDLCPSQPTQRKHVYDLFRSILASATKDELIDRNPAEATSAKVKRASETEIATPAEVEAIASEMPERLRLAVYLASWGGLRSGEIRELRRKDVEVVDGRAVVKVRRGVTKVGGKYVVGAPKTEAAKRDVHLPPELTHAMEEHLAAIPADREALLFEATGGGHLSSNLLLHHYTKARLAAGRPDLRFHDLRHTGLTWAARAGATLAELMARAGHTTPDMAMRYQHAASERDRMIADRMGAMREEALSATR